MTEWFIIAAKAFWCGWAALGFGILFNAPARALLAIWVAGFVTGLIKFTALHPVVGLGIIGSSFIAAMVSGFVVVFIATWQKLPPSIIAIPSVIPLIPGIFAYKTMLGAIRLTTTISDDYSAILSTTIHTGLKTLFIVLGISLGVAIPIQLFRKRLPLDPRSKIPS
jgi:uncharacterized membrane protein YjjB (DUF3815 family)